MGNNSVPKFIFRLSRFPIYRGSVLGRFYCITILIVNTKGWLLSKVKGADKYFKDRVTVVEGSQIMTVFTTVTKGFAGRMWRQTCHGLRYVVSLCGAWEITSVLRERQAEEICHILCAAHSAAGYRMLPCPRLNPLSYISKTEIEHLCLQMNINSRKTGKRRSNWQHEPHMFSQHLPLARITSGFQRIRPMK